MRKCRLWSFCSVCTGTSIYTANEGRWESNINVWFSFMYFQKWNSAPSLFPKHNYNVLPPNSYTHISVRDLHILLQLNMWTDPVILYINRSQTHECGNWDWGRAIPRKGIHKWDFLCSADEEQSEYSFLGLHRRASGRGGWGEGGPTRRCGPPTWRSSVSVQYTLQQKSHICIPFFKETARPQSQFPHSCVSERCLFYQDRSTYFLQQNRQINRGNI